MAIYFPPFFCGKGTVIKAKGEFVIDFGNSETVSFGERCIVDEIVGYGYNIKRETGHKVFRIMNSAMPDYFDIVKKVEPENELEYSAYRSRDREIITLIKDFEIKGVISITKGQEFIHFIDANDSVPYHDLFLIDGKARILRMKDNEFLEYFKH